MKKIKKQIITAALSLALLTSMTPTVAFANENYTAQLVMEVTSDAGEFPASGDQVKVSLYMQNAGWAQKQKGTGWGGGLISLTYDSTVLQYVDFAEEKIVSDAFDDITEHNVDHGATSEILWLGMNRQLSDEVSFTNQKTKLAEVIFVVKEDLPQNLDNVLEFSYPQKFDFLFGDLDKPDQQVPGLESAAITPVLHNKVKFDTTAPTVTLDGSTQTTFYYSPVKAEIKDTSGVRSVTLDGKALASPYTISKSGTLVVTDKTGNSTTTKIVIDDAAYLAAKTAIEKLPETIGEKDQSLIAAARKAVEAVTDKTAKGKLDIARLEKAEAALGALQKEKAALLQELAGTKFTISLKQEHITPIKDLRAKVDQLTKKGAVFTTEELKALTLAEADLTALQSRSQKVHDAINALPEKDKVLWGHKASLEEIKKQMPELLQLGDHFSESEQKKVADAGTALDEIQAAANQLKAEMEALPDQVDGNSQNLLNELEKKMTALRSRGYPVDEATMGKTAMDRYNTFKAAVNKETPSEPASPAEQPTTSAASAAPSAASPIMQTGDASNLPALIASMVLFGAAAFFTGRKRKNDL